LAHPQADTRHSTRRPDPHGATDAAPARTEVSDMPIAKHPALPRFARAPWASWARRRGSRGFTLIELMIAVAIVGILVGVAQPNYREFVIRGHLADSSNGLALMRAQMERHYQDNRTYATAGTFTTPCASTDAAPRTFNNFVVTCSGTPTATAFTLTATGSGPVAGFAFTINQSDVRATTSAPAGWNTCATKWLTKKGSTC
jgi:type IV pilus assembly protein PilE